MSEPSGPGPSVVEVTDESFVADVLEESKSRPVVVDFWAEWCAPCRMIGPVLERLAGEYAGQFRLAKLDVDSNPQAAAAFRIQSIPAVKAFRDGELVDEFIGAIPEDSIRAFLESVVPSDADRLVAEATRAGEADRPDEAERLLSLAVQSEPEHKGAALALGGVAASRGDGAEARRLLEPLRPDPEAERLLAAIEVSDWATAPPSGDGALAAAERAAGEGRFEEALKAMLAEVMERGEAGDRAREAMLKLFAVLGESDPLTGEYRPKLASALY